MAQNKKNTDKKTKNVWNVPRCATAAVVAAARGQIAGTSENPKKSKKNWKKFKVVDRICVN